MKEQLITFETAKLAKEKGFDVVSDELWVNNYTGLPWRKWKIDKNQGYHMSSYSAPTQSLLQKWLREEKEIGIVVQSDWCNGEFNGYEFHTEDEEGLTQGDTFETYEQALEAGLIEALKLI